MAWFIIFAGLGWLLARWLILIEPHFQHDEKGSKSSPSDKYDADSSKNTASGRSKNVTIPIVPAFRLVIVPLLVTAVIWYAVIRYMDNYLYRFYDYFNRLWIAQCLLGLGFGVILALWVRRLYLLKAKDEMSLQHKVEGVALLLLFIVGTSSTPLSDLVKDLKIALGGVEVSFARNAAPSTAQVGKEKANLTLPGQGSTTERCRYVVCEEEELGLRLAGALPSLVSADAARALRATDGIQPLNAVPSATAPSTGAGSATQSGGGPALHDLARLTSCLKGISKVALSQEFANSSLLTFKPFLQDLYLVSLQELKSPDDKGLGAVKEKSIESLDAQIEKTARDAELYAVRLDAIRKDERLDQCTDIIKNTSLVPQELLAPDSAYIPTLYAFILQIDHREGTGIDLLDRWKEEFKRTHSRAILQNRWTLIRIYQSKYLLFENLFRNEPSALAIFDQLRAHIENTKLLIDELSDIDWISKAYKDNFASFDNDYSDNYFRITPSYKHNCSEEKYADAIRLSYAIVTYKAVYVIRAAQHPGFAKSYAPDAAAYALEIANGDYGCYLYDLNDPEAWRALAESLKSYAVYQEAYISARQAKEGADKSYDVRELRKAVGALENALTIASDTLNDTNIASEITLQISRIKGSISQLED